MTSITPYSYISLIPIIYYSLILINMSKRAGTNRSSIKVANRRNIMGKHYPVLDVLLGSRAKAKLLKFLFRNYPVKAGIKELSRRIQEPVEVVKKEIKELEKIKLVQRQ